MEDSSINPYIPGGSEQLQRKVERPQTAFARIAKTALIAGGVLFALIGIALIFILQNTSKVDEQARAELAAVLQPAEQSRQVTIKSELGFSVSYPEQLFTSHGEIGASRIAARKAGEAQAVSQSYENNDLKVERSYGLIRITPIESSERARAAVALPPELEINSYDKNLLLQTDEQKAAEAEKARDSRTAVKGQLAVTTFVEIDSKKRLRERTSDDGTIVTIEATKPVRQEIAGTEYQKVRYTTKNETHQVTTEKYTDCYYTIQNEQPYSACVINVRPNKVSVAALLEDVIRSVSYQAPKDTAIASDTQKTSEDTNGEKETEQITIAPAYLKEPAILKAIAKNQPNVVRIGMLYCANIALKRVDGSTGKILTDACASKLASGVFISKTGHIATAGHAVKYDAKEAINGYINLADSQDEMQERLQRVLDYMLEGRLLQQDSVEYLKTGAATGNQDALAKIENLGALIPSDYVQASNEKYDYAIELTDKPIVLNRATGNKPSFAYSDTVVKADFVRSDYDASKYAQEQFDSKRSAGDIALLKINATVPVSPVGKGDTLGANQKLATIGYPAYSDGTLTADKILNVPIALMSSVNQTFDQDGKKVINANTPILPGSDGAAVFDASAQLVGFAAYGPSFCPDRQCFGSGTMRSSNELLAMIDKHNMELDYKSNLSDVWNEAVEAYFAGNYQTAASKFTQAGKLYAVNQWAPKLAELSKSKAGSASDTSLMNTLGAIGIGTLIFLAISMTALGILLFIHLKRLDMLQVGHYGATSQSSAPQSIVVPPLPSASPNQPYAQPNQPPTTPSPQWQQQPPTSSQQYPQQPQSPYAQPPVPPQPTQPTDNPYERR